MKFENKETHQRNTLSYSSNAFLIPKFCTFRLNMQIFAINGLTFTTDLRVESELIETKRMLKSVMYKMV